MDVAIVSPKYPPNISGGGEVSVKLLVDQLYESKRIDHIQVYTFDGAIQEYIDGVHVTRIADYCGLVKELFNIVAVAKLKGRLDEFDVVHSYNMALHPSLGYLTRRSNFNSVATLNSYSYLPESVVNVDRGRMKRLYSFASWHTSGKVLRHEMGNIDAYLSLSNAVKDIYSNYGFDGDKIETIPNMLDPTFSQKIEDEPNRVSDTEDCQILFVGRLDKTKGVEYLVRSLQYLPEKYKLKIAGDGEEYHRLRTLSDKLELIHRVEFLGKVPYEQIAPLYLESDVFAHPGIWPEPFGRTIIEAMQAGLPVVATNIGGPSEIVPHEKFLCEPSNPQSMAESIKTAHDSSKDSKWYRRYVWENYCPSNIVDSIIDLYCQIS